MSPSHTTANSHADPAALRGQDFLISLLIHASVIIAIVILALWKSENIIEPLQRIQVSVVTPDQLEKMIRHAAVKKHLEPKSHPVIQPVKPVLHPVKPVLHPVKPVLHPVKPVLHPVKPVLHEPKKINQVEKPIPEKKRPQSSTLPSLPKQRAKPHKHEPAFNPFVPLESKSDVNTAPSRSSNSQMAKMQMQQLSKQEVNRYIAMIQEAVEQHWKVPVSLGHVSNPRVELKLRPDGSVVSISILDSSGDASLDASLSRAIRAAAPFELPQNQFEAFSDMTITFVPLVNQQQ